MRRLAPIAITLAVLLLIGGGTALFTVGAPWAGTAGQPGAESAGNGTAEAPPGSGEQAPGARPPASGSQNPARLFITTPPPGTLVAGTRSAIPLTATGGTPPYSWAATGGSLPPGLTFDAAGSMISGIPTTAGRTRVRIRATGAGGESDTVELPLHVTGTPAVSTIHSNTSPIEGNGGSGGGGFTVDLEVPPGIQGVPYTHTIETRGGRPPVTFSVLGLPAGVLLDPVSGTLSGTPQTGGLSPLSTTATDAAGRTASGEAQFFVEAAPLTVLTPPVLGPVVPGGVVAEPLLATGGYPPYSWEVVALAELEEVRVSPSPPATLAGTAPEEAGSYPLALILTDAAGTAILHDASLPVRAGELEITTPLELPQARLGEPLDLVLEATGGTPPLTWSTPFLPEEITLTPTGVLAGTPEQPLAISFEATVTDASGETATGTFSLRAGSDVAPARNLQAFPSDGKAAFTWQLPDDPTLESVVLVANLAAPPRSPEDGTPLYHGVGSSVLAGDLPTGTSLYLAVFSIDREGGFAPPPADAHTTLHLRPFTLAKSDATTNADPHADAVADYSPLSSTAYGANRLSDVLGPPDGPGGSGGALNVVSLNATVGGGGSITLTFEDNLITDGAGPDFTVFENPFSVTGSNDYFVEPAIVSVSQDGETFYTFPFDYVPHFKSDGVTPNLLNRHSYPTGFAGITPTQSQGTFPDPTDPAVSGGDQFDLAALGIPGLTWVRHVRITSTGDSWLTDRDGDLVRHHDDRLSNTLSGEGNSGFDLDAVTAIHY